MERDPTATAQLKVRLREDLRLKLEFEARRHRFTLANEIRIRLEDSFTAADARDLHMLIQDLKDERVRMRATRDLLELGDRMVGVLEGKAPADPSLPRLWRAARRALDTGSVI